MPLQQPAPERYKEFLSEFARDRNKLFRYIFSLIPNYADAEDVFQRCSLVLWEKFSEFDPGRPFLPWACGIAFNEVRYFLRTGDRKHLLFDSDLLSVISDARVNQLDQSTEILGLLSTCLKKLSRRDRELVRVAYGKNLTLKEFAESVNSAPQTLYNSLGRIRRQLQTCVRQKLAAE
ncbi:sigma-70 family RNA polymerase sigma factor [Planctomicrobium sp. SH661]|uniref:sigma-70 family RNA polymerase sigma factor n=1 Tax=Planctomicrobium sp. SH661 TaxID=3448124 RepID=UPI003F5C49BF